MESNSETELFKKLFVDAAQSSLARNQKLLDDLNVFPVPDGDTGSNMLQTVKGVAEALNTNLNSTTTLKDVATAAYDACLLNARGNSGLLLSFFFKGLNEAITDDTAITGQVVATALSQAAINAKETIPSPKEGTIITVFRRAGEQAQQDADQGKSLEGVLASATATADQAVKETPTQLEILRNAGVVDSGGLGVAIVLRAALNTLTDAGEVNASAEQYGVTKDLKMDSEYLADVEETAWGYCIGFVITGENIPVDDVKDFLQEHGRSSLAVGTQQALKVHVHSQDPGEILSFAVRHGALSNIDISNMELQAADWAQQRRDTDEPPPNGDPNAPAAETGLVTVADGQGMQKLFKHFAPHAITVVDGGPKMNPSVKAIQEALNSNPAQSVVILPNSSDIVGTAETAAKLSTEKEVKVLPTLSMPAGMMTVMEFDPSQDLNYNHGALNTAIEEIGHGSVFRASHSATLDGVTFNMGDYVAAANGKLLLTASNAEEALIKALEKSLEGSATCFIYYGADADRSQAELIENMLEEASIKLEEVDVLFGGQSHYQYLFAWEI